MKAQLIFRSSLLLVLLLVVASGCKKPTYSTQAEFGSSLDGLNGSWRLTKVTETDEVIKVATKPSLDITSFSLGGGSYSLTFNKVTKQYTASGTVQPDFLGTSGTFAFDNPDYPSAIIFTNAAGTKFTMTLGLPVRAEYNNPLLLKWTHQLRTKKGVTYGYTFSR